jgi:hypothetical protein
MEHLVRHVLLRPFAYLTIQHSDPVLRWVNWYLPCMAAVVTACLWFLPWGLNRFGFISPGTVNIWGDKGLVGGLLGFVQSLPGFYTAALAAVATFGGKDMNQLMPGQAPRMRLLFEGKLTEPLGLTRRLFLSVMFGYLTALSFLLTVAAIAGTSLSGSVAAILLPGVRPWVSAVATALYVLFFTQLLSVTGWGLYYLGERMHIKSSDDLETDATGQDK